MLSSLPAPSSHLQRLPSSLVGAKASLICIGTVMMASNPVFVKMSVLSGMSASVRLFQVSSHSRELVNHIIANSLAYQRLSAKVKQSNGFRDNDRTEFLQNATEAHKARCPNVHNLEVHIFNFWSNTN